MTTDPCSRRAYRGLSVQMTSPVWDNGSPSESAALLDSAELHSEFQLIVKLSGCSFTVLDLLSQLVLRPQQAAESPLRTHSTLTCSAPNSGQTQRATSWWTQWRPELERILDWEIQPQVHHINLEREHNLNLVSLKVLINMSLEWYISDVASTEWRMMLLFEMEWMSSTSVINVDSNNYTAPLLPNHK